MEAQREGCQQDSSKEDAKFAGMTPAMCYLAGIAIILAFFIGLASYSAWQLSLNFLSLDIAEPFRRRSNSLIAFSTFTIQMSFFAFAVVLGTVGTAKLALIVVGDLKKLSSQGRSRMRAEG